MLKQQTAQGQPRQQNKVGRLPSHHACLTLCFHMITLQACLLTAVGSSLNQLMDLAAEAGPSSGMSMVIWLPLAMISQVPWSGDHGKFGKFKYF